MAKALLELPLRLLHVSLAVLSLATGSLTPAPPRPQIAVAIAGGGLSGLALAVGLKMAGVEDVLVIRLIEKAPALRTKSQGAMRLTTAGLARGRPRLDIRTTP